MVRIFRLMLVLLHIYIYSTNIPPIMIINMINETQTLLSLELASVLVGLRTYQHPCTKTIKVTDPILITLLELPWIIFRQLNYFLPECCKLLQPCSTTQAKNFIPIHHVTLVCADVCGTFSTLLVWQSPRTKEVYN
jgi:hypothetical protein